MTFAARPSGTARARLLFELVRAAHFRSTAGMSNPGKRIPFTISPRALIRNPEGLWLFIRRSDTSQHWAGQWEPPGGKMDAGESVDVTLEREVAEETGLKISEMHAVGATEGAVETARFVVLVLETKVESGAVRLSDEHGEFMWVTRRDAANLDLAPVYADFIKQWSAAKEH